MINVVGRMAIIFAIICVGFLLNRTRLLPEDADKALSTLVIYIANPALIFYSVLSEDMKQSRLDTAEYVIISFVFYAVMIIVGRLISLCPLFGRFPRKQVEAMLVFTNMGFIGLPVIQSIYGNEGVFYIAIMGIPFNIFVYSYGVYLLQKGGGRPDMRKVINPSVIAAVLVMAIYFVGVDIPGVVMDFAEMLGNVTVPLALIIVGFNLAKEPLMTILADKTLYVFLALKLAVFPALIWLIFGRFISNEIFLGAMVIVAAMPVGSNVSMIYREYGDDTGGAEIAGCTVLSTLASAVTIPVWAAILL